MGTLRPRWSQHGTEEEHAPKGGPEAREAALKALEAECGPLDRDQRESAEAAIEEAAHDFLVRRSAIEDAPRVADVREAVERIADRARALSEAVQSLDDYSIEALVAGWQGAANPTESARELAEPADLVEGLPMQAGDYSRWEDRLDALAERAETALRELPRDSGGKGNLYGKRQRHPNELLALSGWELCADLGGTPTATRQGPFHRFLDALYTYATGEPPPGDETLRPYIRRVDKTYRRKAEIEERLRDIEELLVNDRGGRFYRPEERRRMQHELVELQREHNELMGPLVWRGPSRG